MSSTIDAAIIKALVEHIGGNPDSIPDGPIGGGGSTNEYIPNPEYTISLTLNQDLNLIISSNAFLAEIIHLGDVIRFSHTNGNTHDYYCISISKYNDEYSFEFLPEHSTERMGEAFYVYADSSAKTCTCSINPVIIYDKGFDDADNTTISYLVPNFGIGHVLTGITDSIKALFNRLESKA